MIDITYLNKRQTHFGIIQYIKKIFMFAGISFNAFTIVDLKGHSNYSTLIF